MATVLGAIASRRALSALRAPDAIRSSTSRFIFAVIVSVHALDGLAWVIAAVGFGAAARALVRDLEPSEA